MTSDFDRLFATAVAVAFGIYLARCFAGVLLLACARLPTRWSAQARRMSEVVTPRLVRRLVALLLGLIGGAGLATPVHAVGVPDLDRLPAQSQDVTNGHPTSASSSERALVPPNTAAARGGGPELKKVKPGDTLWRLAERQLRAAEPGRVKPPRAERIDQQWREWYQINRAKIGSDPDVIRTGSWLRVPQIADPQASTTTKTTTGTVR